MSLRVGLASIDSSPKEIFNPKMASAILQQYTVLIKELSHQGAKVILLPEEILTIDSLNKQEIKEKLSKLAKQNQITLIAGINYIHNIVV